MTKQTPDHKKKGLSKRVRPPQQNTLNDLIKQAKSPTDLAFCRQLMRQLLSLITLSSELILELRGDKPISQEVLDSNKETIKAEKKLEKSWALFKHFAEKSGEVFWQATPSLDRLIYISPAYETIWKRDRKKLYSGFREWLDAIVESDRQKVLDAFLPNNDNVALEFKIKRPDGTLRKVFARGFLVKDKQGNIESKIGIMTDLTDIEKFHQHHLIQTDVSKILTNAKSLGTVVSKILKLICKILNCIVGEIWLLDEKQTRLYCYRNFSLKRDLFKPFLKARLTLSFPIGVDVPGLVWETRKAQWIYDYSKYKLFAFNKIEDLSKIKTIIGFPIVFQSRLMGTFQFYSEEKLAKDPVLQQLLMNVGALLGEFISYRHTDEEFNYIIKHDYLTGFLNRFAWGERVDWVIANKSFGLMAVLLFEIDQFKTIIEYIGYDGADELLKIVANKIHTQLIGSSDFLGRLNFDEFAIALCHVTSLDQVKEVAGHLLSLFDAPFYVRGHKFFITLSIGISLYPQESQALLINANKALEQIKEDGGNGYKVFSQKSDVPIRVRKIDLENQLHRALDEEQFNLHYQPLVDLRTKKITGFEALLRWQHPDRGLLLPAEFLPTLEQSHLIISVGEWVLREACRDLLKYNLEIGVNISAYQFRPRYHFVRFLRRLLHELNVSPECLNLELTESVMFHDVMYGFKTLNELKKLSIHFSLDDFGTGYSCLNYLKLFPVNKIKIDKSFVDGLPHDKNNKAIVSAILGLSHGLGFKTVAEGVETKEQWDYLSEIGCDEIQGFYFSKPLPIQALDRFIKEQSQT